MTIIVGRGRTKATQKIEISDPTVSREHCWLTDNGDGTYTLEDKKSLHGTFVNGNKILKTTVTPETLIKLGESTTVRVADLIPSPPQKEYSIRHLEQVWDKYNNSRLKMEEDQRKIGLWRSAAPIFTMGSGIVAFCFGIPQLGTILMLIGVGIMIFSFIKSSKKNFIEEREKLKKEFHLNYVCPNCGQFIGEKPYYLVQNQKNCLYCKCKFTES